MKEEADLIYSGWFLWDLIISHAHEVVLVTYSKDQFICRRCNYTGTLAMLFGSEQRCFGHYEKTSSGWHNDLPSV